MDTQKKLVVIGFGRFGQLFAGLARSHYTISVIEPDAARRSTASALGYEILDVSQAIDADIIVLAVPISSLESVVKLIAPLTKPHQLVMDVCSVKVHPARVMQTYLSHCQLIATHPMFGPDSAARGLKNLKVAFCHLGAKNSLVEEWRSFWEQKGVAVIETTPEEHDRNTAYTQALPYTIAHIINTMQLPEILFNTRSSDALVDIAKYSAKDSEQLYRDMLAYNPYAKLVLTDFENAATKTLSIAHDTASSKV